jgi:ATP-dependent Lon protease
MAQISADRIEAPATNETSPCHAPQARVVGISIAQRLGRLKAVLDERHAGHEEVKQAILEHFNVGLRREAAGLPGVGPVLCLEGPPGAGKTTLAGAVAAGLERPLVPVPLPGVTAAFELAGTSPQWKDAGRGLIAVAFDSSSRADPVILLDEIDKMGSDSQHGAPWVPLLVCLDPAQSSRFVDQFDSQERDLSQVWWIATANATSGMNPALRDRLEILRLSSYTDTEKFEIAIRHLIPARLAESCLSPGDVIIDEDVLLRLVERCSEPGVRPLKRQIDRLIRFAALRVTTTGRTPQRLQIADVEGRLGLSLAKPNVSHTPISGSVTTFVENDGSWAPSEIEVCAVAQGNGITVTSAGSETAVTDEIALAVTVVRTKWDELGLPLLAAQTGYAVRLGEGVHGPLSGTALVLGIASYFLDRPVEPHLLAIARLDLHGRLHSVPDAGVIAAQAAHRGNHTVFVAEPFISRLGSEHGGLDVHVVRTVQELLTEAFGTTRRRDHYIPGYL